MRKQKIFFMVFILISSLFSTTQILIPNVIADGEDGNNSESLVYVDTTIQIVDSVEAFDIYIMMRMRNGDKLPICMVGACHNSEFNVSFFNYKVARYDYYPTPECWSWWMTRKVGGGAIATIGYTGLEWVATWGWDDDDIPDCTQYFSGYIDSRFYHAYGVDGVEFLGECWGQAISEYLDRFPSRPFWDVKTPTQWHLMGDPSLKIGGYLE